MTRCTTTHRCWTEFAMLELARAHVDPEYVVTSAPGRRSRRRPVHRHPRRRLPRRRIPQRLDRPLAGEVRGSDETLRQIADASLIGALGVSAEPAPAPRERQCRTIAVPPGAESTAFEVAPGKTLLRPSGNERPASGWPASPTRQASASTTCPPAAGPSSRSPPTKPPTPGGRRSTTRWRPARRARARSAAGAGRAGVDRASRPPQPTSAARRRRVGSSASPIHSARGCPTGHRSRRWRSAAPP